MDIAAIFQSPFINNSTNAVKETNNVGLYCWAALTALLFVGTTFAISKNRPVERGIGVVASIIIITISAVEITVVGVLGIDIISRIFNLPWKILDKIFPNADKPRDWDFDF